jgi:small subunit ribosomal protein S14
MAKCSVNNRNKKRQQKVVQYSTKRAEYKKNAYDLSLPFDERIAWHQKLQKLCRDSSKTRVRNRCRLTGRGRGVFKKFGLSRIKLREYAMRGEIPGLVKSSW